MLQDMNSILFTIEADYQAEFLPKAKMAQTLIIIYLDKLSTSKIVVSQAHRYMTYKKLLI